MKRLLITTADETTWSKNKPILFLGEWCTKYSKRYIWKKLDFITAKPYGNSIVSKKRDYKISLEIENELKTKIGIILNKYHNVNYNQQMWGIMIGPWIKRYSSLIINRVGVLKQCFENYEIDEVFFKDINIKTVIEEDSKKSVDLFENQNWNQYLNQEIIKLLKVKNLKYNYLKKDHVNKTKILKNITNYKLKFFFKIIIFKFLKLTNYFSRYNKIATINTYFNLIEFLKFNLSLRIFPYFRLQDEKLKLEKSIDQVLRNKLSSELILSKDNQSINEIAKSLIFHFIPICYLEGFKRLLILKDQTFFPLRPKYIFTSINCDTDEIFKLWTVNMLLNGSKLIVYQHGSNYGTEKRDNNPSMDEMISDYFINWGWAKDNTKYIPSRIINRYYLNSNNYKKRNKNKMIYLIENLILQSYRTQDVYSEFENYFNEQKKFVSLIDSKIRNNLIIKLHSTYDTHNNCEELIQWKDFNPDLIIDKGKKKFKNVIKSSKIIVFSYDSTGFLECLAFNIPCVAFWQDKLDHVRDEAKSYYEILKNAGLLFFSADSIASHVNKVYEDTDSWWFSEKIQSARKIFCDKYANTNNLQPNLIVKKLLKDVN